MTSQYNRELTRFMSFKDGVTYSNDRVFTTAELLQVTPGHLCHWMHQQAYGDPEPTEDMKPVYWHSMTQR
ncbi:uncharacterized protein PITG_08983 [Phytophthora infestans T30-4]|uniref:Uncharacterized protein n=1 Tax=Phytophthora infestans (strain T30-4) TaxID=403677 RepID=D0NDN2_PHYIT|nr:uncharacterized protein PITG_08983 [Phytophthora infestans T30-4]EEY56189.1 conserved hypothetical protein [Phytophthora infestans T30-4]|eukprot:XP_002903019.1 conserved hypothetical protein [Phytophthora infestans T30-4]